MKLKTLLASAALVGMFAAPMAQAAFNHVYETGKGPVRVIHYNGDNVPVGMAVKQFAPRNWKVSLHGVTEETRVSWVGGRNWVDILEDVGRLNKLKFQVDWSHNRIHVFGNEGVVEAPAVLADIHYSGEDRFKLVKEGALQWVLPLGRLSEALDLRLSQADWRLEWKRGTDFEITVPVTVYAQDVVGMLREIQELYQVPIAVCRGNSTAIVYEEGSTEEQIECAN